MEHWVESDGGEDQCAWGWKSFDTLRPVVDGPTYWPALHQHPDLLPLTLTASEQLFLDAGRAGDDVLPLLRHPLHVDDLLHGQVADDLLEELGCSENTAESDVRTCRKCVGVSDG